MVQISNSELRKIQIDILQYIHEFCIENKIQYSLAYGTLLGAVRHRGYIPWDDDIDIAMLRPDYERFVSLFNGTYEIYTVAEARLDKDVALAFAKVYDNRTIIHESGNTKNLGVFVDVFPIDDLYNDYEDSVIYFNSFAKYRFILNVKCRTFSTVKKWWKIPFLAICKILYFNVNIHALSIKNINNAKSHTFPNSKYVALLISGAEKANEIVERKIWNEFDLIEFEGHKFLCVKDTDSYLKHAYGDYMKLPPIEQQVPKHDFNGVYWK